MLTNNVVIGNEDDVEEEDCVDYTVDAEDTVMLDFQERALVRGHHHREA